MNPRHRRKNDNDAREMKWLAGAAKEEDEGGGESGRGVAGEWRLTREMKWHEIKREKKKWTKWVEGEENNILRKYVRITEPCFMK